MKTYAQLEDELGYIASERDAQNKELVAAKAELSAIRAAIPEGYLIAKDTLAESVKLMVDCLRAYSEERKEMFEEINKLNMEAVLREENT